MVQGAEYVNGQYTYRYMQEGDESESDLIWKNIEEDGWGVQLTDKTSTEPVTSKLCTYINNKPVTSMSYVFTGSSNLVGGAGTTYNSSYIAKTYARIDGGTSNPGYFTLKNS